ncbi:MAG: cation transporter [Bacilli bacterium]|nr:cation transporter [Bacilli bacterium]
MKKVFKIEIDCANCAAKVEEAVKKIDGVNSASLNFMTQKMILDLDESRMDEILEVVKKTAKKIEPDFCILK